MRARLKTETNTRTMERRVRIAARSVLGLGYSVQTDFEHGQWWVTDLKAGRQWSVVDANTLSGFDFEQVTQGEEE